MALVKFLLALTDERVKFERAPFDPPEIFIPLDGAAPDLNNLGGINCGRASLVNDPRFRHIAAVGASGLTVPLTNFLGVSSLEGSACTDHFDQASVDGGPGCAEVLPIAPPGGPNVCTVGVPENLAPVADDDAFTQTTLNQVYAVPGVLAGDTDPNFDTITAELVTGLQGLTLNANGSFAYNSALPAPGVPNATVVNFTYNVTDGNLDSNVATVTIALNRAGAPIAVNDAVATAQNTPVTADVDVNDSNGGAPGGALQQASLTVRSQPANGTAVVVGGTNRQVTYTPNAGFVGGDTYTYTISDNTGPSNLATVTVTVTAGPDPGSGLVAAYNFDEAAGDALDSATGDGANNGTLNAGVTRVPGHTGNALSFNGTSGMVTVPDAAALDIARMTISAWVYPTTPVGESTWRNVILKERPGGLVYGLYSNSATDGGPGAYIRRTGGPDEHVNRPARLPANEWVHLAASYDGDVAQAVRERYPGRHVRRAGDRGESPHERDSSANRWQLRLGRVVRGTRR